MEKINPVTKEQAATLLAIPRDRDAQPFRVLCRGRAVDVGSGVLEKRGSNVIYHPVYWDCSQQWQRLALEYLHANNPGEQFKVVTSE